jgi:folate-binding Fe-S cluster repair protein YgfZ
MPSSKTEIALDGQTIGFVGQAVQHAVLGPIASAVVKQNVADDATLQVGHFNAVIG